MTVEMYKNPKGMVVELSALGLRLGLDQAELARCTKEHVKEDRSVQMSWTNISKSLINPKISAGTGSYHHGYDIE